MLVTRSAGTTSRTAKQSLAQICQASAGHITKGLQHCHHECPRWAGTGRCCCAGAAAHRCSQQWRGCQVASTWRSWANPQCTCIACLLTLRDGMSGQHLAKSEVSTACLHSFPACRHHLPSMCCYVRLDRPQACRQLTCAQLLAYCPM